MIPQCYNVLIIGAGNVGAFFDSPESDMVLTHAHAFTRHKGFSLLGFVDSDIEKSKKATAIWRGSFYANIEEAFNKEKVDLAVVAVPDEWHYSVLKELSRFPLRAIFAEKPLTKSLPEAEEIMGIFNKKGIPVAVNYSRRFIPEIEKIKEDIRLGLFGGFITGTGYYGKGIVHNGSHMVDLMRFLVGEVREIKPISALADFYEDDKSVSAVLEFDDKGFFYLGYVDCRNYTVFEVDLLFEKRRIRISDPGYIEEFEVLESKLFKGYRNIVKSSEFQASFKDALYNAAENIFRSLTDGQALKCTAEDGYKTLKTSIDIRDSIE